jgi:glycosyltransferase involved in cell wall biosynthesis
LKNPSKQISIIICSYRAPITLYECLNSIKSASFPRDSVEVILVNNGFPSASEKAIYDFMKSHLQVDFRIVNEPEPGLGFARRKGFIEAEGNFLILIDDDQFLDPDFLSVLIGVIDRYPEVGCICPIVEPVWEKRPDDWLVDFGRFCLSYNAAEKYRPNFSEEYWPPEKTHEAMRPPGGGMIIKHTVADYYLQNVKDPKRICLARNPTSLIGCEDEDIFSGVAALGIAIYFTNRLVVYHHIPRSRIKFSYLLRLNFQMLYSYGILDRFKGISVKILLPADLWRLVRNILRSSIMFFKGKKPFQQLILETVRELGLIAGHLATN